MGYGIQGLGGWGMVGIPNCLVMCGGLGLKWFVWQVGGAILDGTLWCVRVCVGEYMVCDDGSDTEDSFSNEEEEEEESTAPSLSGDLISATTTTSSTPSSSSASEGGKVTPAAGASASTTTEATSEGGGGGGKREGGKGHDGGKEKEREREGGGEGGGGPEDKGDPEMAPVYLQRLLPVFTEIYHSSLAPALRKESLRLIRKMCRYISPSCLQHLCQDATPTATDSAHPLFLARISEVLAAVMETEEDHEGHLSALYIMQDLLAKNRPAFDEQFVRLGLPNKIAALAGLLEGDAHPQGEEEGASAEEAESGKPSEEDGSKEEADGGDRQDTPSSPAPPLPPPSPPVGVSEEPKPCPPPPPPTEEKACLEDATDIVIATPYQWRDWCMVRSRDCLYLWNDYCVVELSNVSNGWFRFLVDSRLATMYSSGSTEGGPDSYGEHRAILQG